MVQEYYLLDVATFQKKTETLRFTHFCSSSHARLDRAYVSAELLTGADEYKVLPIIFSDHAQVTFTLGEARRKTNRFSWGLWKFNSKLLDDKVLTNMLEALMGKMSSGHFISSAEAWEVTKQEIKLAALERSHALKYFRDKEENILRADLKRLLKLESKYPGIYLNDIRTTKNSLSEIETEKYKGAIVRARAEKYLLGEQPTKRALSREKHYASKKRVCEIEYRGSLSSKDDVLQQAFVEYYTSFQLRSERG